MTTDLEALYEQLDRMTDAARSALDPLCDVLDVLMRADPPDRGHLVANRLMAIAALNAARQCEQTLWDDQTSRD